MRAWILNCRTVRAEKRQKIVLGQALWMDATSHNQLPISAPAPKTNLHHFGHTSKGLSLPNSKVLVRDSNYQAQATERKHAKKDRLDK
jgi:hypothetical protein